MYLACKAATDDIGDLLFRANFQAQGQGPQNICNFVGARWRSLRKFRRAMLGHLKRPTNPEARHGTFSKFFSTQTSSLFCDVKRRGMCRRARARGLLRFVCVPTPKFKGPFDMYTEQGALGASLGLMLVTWVLDADSTYLLWLHLDARAQLVGCLEPKPGHLSLQSNPVPWRQQFPFC